MSGYSTQTGPEYHQDDHVEHYKKRSGLSKSKRKLNLHPLAVDDHPSVPVSLLSQYSLASL